MAIGKSQAQTPLKKLSHYSLLEQIGAGGMGEVYRARDENLDRIVAIKILPSSSLAEEESRQRFRHEALTLSRVDHPTIATIHEFDTVDGVDFLVTEFVPGETLADVLQRGRLSQKEVVELGLQLAEGLSVAHKQGVVHRDIKPANLRITPDGRLKIVDFGLAAEVPGRPNSDTVSSESKGISGTIGYMAPEQLMGGAVDVRSDIFSTGVVLYEAVAGVRPFRDELLSKLIKAIIDEQPLALRHLRVDVAPRLEEIIGRCLEKNANLRYQSAADLLADFRRLVVTGFGTAASIAVLYFENLSHHPEEEYFRDGITEDITTELAKIKGFKVFSRSAVFPYRDKPATPIFVGQQIGATHVVEGSIRREHDKVRITAKLVEAKTGHAAWAEKYDRRLEDIFAVQDEIATSIAGALRVALTHTETKEIEAVPTSDVRAYDYYLKGRHYFHQFRRKGLDVAREMFSKAIALDPNYARAYAGIAYCSAFLYMYWDSSTKNLEQADEASRKALELAPQLSEAHSARGLTVSLKKDYETACEEFDTAIRLNPTLVEPYYFAGRNYYSQGKLEEAVHWFDQASKAAPDDYQSPMLMASALHGLGRSDDALGAYRRGLLAAEKHLEIYPGDCRALYFGANALTQIDERERAITWAERALELEPEEPQVLYNVACVFCLAGINSRAMDCLEKCLTGGWGQKEWIEHDPDLAPLRGEQRFQALLTSK